jgi:hypothetical protein
VSTTLPIEADDRDGAERLARAFLQKLGLAIHPQVTPAGPGRWTLQVPIDLDYEVIERDDKGRTRIRQVTRDVGAALLSRCLSEPPAVGYQVILAPQAADIIIGTR